MTPPQILPDSVFGRLLTDLAKDSNRIVEIGAGCGLGSTLCLANGLVRPEQRLFSVEADDENYAHLCKNQPGLNILKLRGVISRGIKPYWHPVNLVQHREAWTTEWELLLHAPIAMPGLDQGLGLFKTRAVQIDLLLLDGGEFCSDADFLHLWPLANVIALDDTNAAWAVKNAYAVQCLTHANWKIVKMNQEDRNGWAVFARP